jgi:hypothetical protein
MNHTPGPWDWFHSPQWGASVETPDTRIANVLRHGGVDHIANATLIAASPKLLAACQAALENPNDAAWAAMREAVADATTIVPAEREEARRLKATAR